MAAFEYPNALRRPISARSIAISRLRTMLVRNAATARKITGRMPAGQKGIFARIAEQLEKTTTNLEGIVGKINSGSQVVRGSATEVAGGGTGDAG